MRASRRSGIKADRGMSLPRAPRPRSARGLRAKTMVAMMMILLFMILLFMIACAAAGLVLGGLRADLLHAAPRRPGRGPGGLEDM